MVKYSAGFNVSHMTNPRGSSIGDSDMPGLIQEDQFKTISVKELHPTFAAEVSGVNFQDMSEEQFSEIIDAMAKVRLYTYPYPFSTVAFPRHATQVLGYDVYLP